MGKKLRCAECGKPIEKPYYIDGKPYGYTCYKQEMSIRLAEMKLAEQEEKNARYSCECFCAMEIFKNKKAGRFHDSICQQWNDCHKLTINQLKAIRKTFSSTEKVFFYALQANLQEDKHYQRSMAEWTETELYRIKIQEQKALIDNELINNALFKIKKYKDGFVWIFDFDYDGIFIVKLSIYETEKDDPEIKLLKIVKPEV